MNLIILIIISICRTSVEVFGVISKQLDVNWQSLANIKYSKDIDDRKDALLDFKGISKKYMRTRPVEDYDITTEDGYILKLFHIPSKQYPKKVVLLSHGILTSSDDFIIRGNTSLIYMLGQNGFDIWAMNYRGNRYSRRHEVLNPDIDADFWEYSMQEFGYYDLAAVIDFILKKTGEAALRFIGHSEGCAALFVLTSQKPEYNNKIHGAVMMAPACYMEYCGMGIKTLVELGPALNDVLQEIGINEVLGYNSVGKRLLTAVCSQGETGYKICLDGLIGIISGFDAENIEIEFLDTILGHFPTGTSRKNLVHYTQIGKSGRFAKYDLGVLNQATYGSDLPPEYHLADVTCKIALIAAKNDLNVGVKDVTILQDKLANVISYYEVSHDAFNHLDYLWGRNAHEVLYPHIINVLNHGF